MAQRTAALYARISRDVDGTALGVTRQRKDCEALAARRGWKAADVYIDDDVSAFSGKRRPEYERMLDDLRAGTVNAVIAWHPDRLHRSPRELEDFIDVIEQAGATVATCTAGDIDLATPDGRLMARIVGSVARKESEDKSRRLRRKHEEIAEAGAVSGGGRRPFGYEADRMTVREAEADEIRQAVAKVIAGESLRSIVADWTERGIGTVTGAHWSPTTVKRLLMSARISGQREHRGTIVGPAIWPAIVTPDDTLRVRAILSNPDRQKGPTATVRSYLLTGFVICGRCAAEAEVDEREAPRMTTRPVMRKGHRYRRYVCTADRGGCDRCGIGAEPLEDLVAEVLFARLDSPKLAKATARKRAKATKGPTTGDDVAQLEGRLTELAEMFAAGDVTRAEWQTARDGIERRLRDAKATVVDEAAEATGSPYVGRSDVLRTEWSDDTLSLDQKRAILAGFIEAIVIAPTDRANNKFDDERVSIVWKA